MLRKTVLCLLVAMILLAGSAPLMPGENPSFPDRPKLVLVLVIDQFRYDYLMRYRPHFVKGGFNRLLDGGARISLVQVYTVARRTAEAYVTPLTADELEQVAAGVRSVGVAVAVFP